MSEESERALRLDLYKLSVEMADRVSARRSAANSFFAVATTALAGLVGRSGEAEWAAAGIVLCASWWLLLRSYRDLSAAKWKVICAMENDFPVRPFTEEWDRLKSDRVPFWRGRYAEQGTVERFVPWAFLAVFVVTLAGA